MPNKSNKKNKLYSLKSTNHKNVRSNFRNITNNAKSNNVRSNFRKKTNKSKSNNLINVYQELMMIVDSIIKRHKTNYGYLNTKIKSDFDKYRFTIEEFKNQTISDQNDIIADLQDLIQVYGIN